MTGIFVVAHHERQEAAALVTQAHGWCVERGVDFWMPPDDAAEVGHPAVGSSRPASDAALVVCLGGDGSMLRSVHLLDGASVPLLGVNLGSLGYLTEVEPADLLDGLARFVAGPERGEWRLDSRMMLDVAINGSFAGRALNEAVVEKNQSGHTVRLLARIDGAAFTYYAADGLIVATPTGSTAYSLSARGPIVSPSHRAVLLTPVSPHMLFDRALVLDPSELVEIEVCGHRRAEVTIDGTSVAIVDDGDVVSCIPSVATADFVRFGTYHYHQILKAKFGLADR